MGPPLPPLCKGMVLRRLAEVAAGQGQGWLWAVRGSDKGELDASQELTGKGQADTPSQASEPISAAFSP